MKLDPELNDLLKRTKALYKACCAFDETIKHSEWWVGITFARLPRTWDDNKRPPDATFELNAKEAQYMINTIRAKNAARAKLTDEEYGALMADVRHVPKCIQDAKLFTERDK
jgi:hypothetical protein